MPSLVFSGRGGGGKVATHVATTRLLGLAERAADAAPLSWLSLSSQVCRNCRRLVEEPCMKPRKIRSSDLRGGTEGPLWLIFVAFGKNRWGSHGKWGINPN